MSQSVLTRNSSVYNQDIELCDKGTVSLPRIFLELMSPHKVVIVDGWGHSSVSVSGVAGDGYLSHKLLFKYCSLVAVCPLEKSTKRMINDAPRTNILISNILRSDP